MLCGSDREFGWSRLVVVFGDLLGAHGFGWALGLLVSPHGNMDP